MNLHELRVANLSRQQVWRGSDQVDLAFRGLELSGEVGELANLLKKLVRIERGISGTRESEDEVRQRIEEEAGDVLVCLDLICMELGINLGEAVREKFNATSFQHRLPTRIGPHDFEAEVRKRGEDTVIRHMMSGMEPENARLVATSIWGAPDFPRPIIDWWPLAKRRELAVALLRNYDILNEKGPEDGQS